MTIDLRRGCRIVLALGVAATAATPIGCAVYKDCKLQPALSDEFQFHGRTSFEEVNSEDFRMKLVCPL